MIRRLRDYDDLITTLAEARSLLEYALHLRMHGERAPGGNETWAEFDRRCEAFLRRGLEGDAPETALSAPVAAQQPEARDTGTSASEPASEACDCRADGPNPLYHRFDCPISPQRAAERTREDRP